MHIYPIRLDSKACRRVWGGNLFAAKFRRNLPYNVPVGELWEISGELPVTNGPYQGIPLNELVFRYPKELMGDLHSQYDSFPLVVKWLDVADWLSVQIHPDKIRAREISGDENATGKTECWYVIEAQEGAEIICGLKKGSLPSKAAYAEGKDILHYLEKLSCRAGDMFLIDAGTVHAIGPGLTILEVQQACDITYRFYDWERMGLDGLPRQLHLEEARASLLHSEKIKYHTLEHISSIGEEILVTPFFALDLLKSSLCLEDNHFLWSPMGRSPEILAVAKGYANIYADGELFEASLGDVVVIPAQTELVKVEMLKESEVVRVIIPK